MDSSPLPRTAIVHYWLETVRGGEKVLREFSRIAPSATLFALWRLAQFDLSQIGFNEVRETFLAPLRRAGIPKAALLPLTPMAVESHDLRGFELVVSSESGPAKGVIADPGATHICYCHSPMRYLYDMRAAYERRVPLLARPAWRYIAHRMRIWDSVSASRVDHFVANSRFVANRIKKYYRRDASVIYPPVDTERFGALRRDEDEYYLYVGELNEYKGIELMIETFARTKRPLVVVGAGSLKKRFAARVPEWIRFLGRVDDRVMEERLRRARALVHAGTEDFGIVMAEAQAAGVPVIALGRGGALDIVKDGETGVLFGEENCDSLRDALVEFESGTWNSGLIRASAQRFSVARFRSLFRSLVDDVMCLKNDLR